MSQVVLWDAHDMGEVPADLTWLSPIEQDRFARMRFEKRRSESLLGRWCAKNTVCQVLGRPVSHEALSGIVIRNAPDGAPEVYVDDAPSDWVIAMTDRADWAVAALKEGPRRVGVDLEVVEPRSKRFVDDYFTAGERSMVERGDHDLMANLIWSAKESSLKVLRTGLRRDTRTVEVILEPGDGGSWTPLTVVVDDGIRHHGFWHRFGDFVLTVVAATDIPPPQALIEPSPLETAVPAHRWMDSIG